MLRVDVIWWRNDNKGKQVRDAGVHCTITVHGLSHAVRVILGRFKMNLTIGLPVSS